MLEMSLNEIQQTGYELLLTFKDYCEKNNLKYFLSNGTLLGAVKYGGYIPWDDDVDVFMPRKDYDRFVCNFIDTDHVKLLAHEKSNQYGFPFAKLCDSHTIKMESYQPIYGNLMQGICIDVFPLDNYSNIKLVAKIQAEMQKIKILLFALSQMDTFKKKNPLKVLIYKLAKSIGQEKIQKWILRTDRYKKGSSKYIGNRVWAIYGYREVQKQSDFSNGISCTFENTDFSIPCGFHNYLTLLYGDYRKDLPIEKQKSHHLYKAYKL